MIVGRSILGAGIALLLMSAGAASAGPGNDDIANAVVVSALPFTVTGDNSTATDQPAFDLPMCGEQANQTVWYRFTPSADERVGVAIDGGLVVVGAGSPDALSEVTGCTEGSFWQAHAGTTYYIEVGNLSVGTGGPFRLSLVRARPLRISVTIDPKDTVDHNTGLATVTGTISCNRRVAQNSSNAYTVLSLDLRQTSVRFTADASLGFYLRVCPTTPVSWTASALSSTIRPFRIGHATLFSDAFACDRFDVCTEASATTAIRLGAS